MVNKRFSINLDIKTPTYSSQITVVEGDNGNIFDIFLTDGGTVIDLTDCRVLAIFSKANGISEQDTDGHGITLDTEQKNKLSIELYTGSFYRGDVTCELQVYSGATLSTLVTSARFNFKCQRPIAGEDTLPSTNEWPLLVSKIRDVQAAEDALGPITSAATAATDSANAAASAANAAASGANTTNSNIQTAESARVTAESGRVSAESARVTAESGRASAETARASAETARASAESTRVTNESARGTAESGRATAETARASAESTRVSNESSRTSAESTRGTNEANRITSENARATAETNRANAETARASAETSRGTAETGRVNAESARASAETSRGNAETSRASAESARVTAENGRVSAESARVTAESGRSSRDAAFQVFEAYDNGHAYVPLNKVSYNGSSYVCIANTTGNAPPNATYWLQIAAKGLDGQGSGDMLKSTYDPNADGIIGVAQGGTGANSAASALPALGCGTGTCSTASATAAKVVVLAGFSLVTGGLIAAKFTNADTSTNPTMNVNSTGAIAIYCNGSAVSSGMITANMMPVFQYDGTYWELLNPAIPAGTVPISKGGTGVTTPAAVAGALGDGYGTCSTAAATAAKVVTCSGYALVTAGFVAVKFSYTDTSTSPTMNVNSTGAKPIYYNGATITAGMINSALTAFFVYDGTQYQLLNPFPTKIGAAASGANSDITSLSGLTTALSVAQGGTGAATAAAALTNLGAQAAAEFTVWTTAGTAPAYTIADTSVTAYSAGLRRTVKFHADGTSATLNFNSLGAKSLYQYTGKAADVKAGQIAVVYYDGTNFFIVNGGGGGIVLPASPTAGDTPIYIKPAYAATNVTSWTNAGTGWGFTAVVAGTYRVQYVVCCGNGAGVAHAQLTKNGTAVSGSEITESAYSFTTKSIDVACAAGDAVRLQLYAQNTSFQSKTYGFSVSILAADLQTAINGLVTAL